MNFLITKQLTDDQTQAIDKALLDHNVDVPGTGANSQFDWLCERIEGSLEGYIKFKGWRPQSRAEVLTDIERLRSAFERMGSGAKSIVEQAAWSTEACELFHHTGLDEHLQPMLDQILETGIGAHGHVSDSVNSSFEWLFDYGQIGLVDIAWEMIKQACDLALSDDPPQSVSSQVDKDNPVKNIIEKSTPNTKGGRPKNDDKHCLVRELSSAFYEATGRLASDTKNGPFDDFLLACLAVIEPEPDGGTYRKLIRKALEHVPKPRRKN